MSIKQTERGAVWHDDDPKSEIVPIYRMMGNIVLGHDGENPLVAMARAIGDDWEVGQGTNIYQMILRGITITITSEGSGS